MVSCKGKPGQKEIQEYIALQYEQHYANQRYDSNPIPRPAPEESYER
jgi:hypothetical protein